MSCLFYNYTHALSTQLLFWSIRILFFWPNPVPLTSNCFQFFFLYLGLLLPQDQRRGDAILNPTRISVHIFNTIHHLIPTLVLAPVYTLTFPYTCPPIRTHMFGTINSQISLGPPQILILFLVRTQTLINVSLNYVQRQYLLIVSRKSRAIAAFK